MNNLEKKKLSIEQELKEKLEIELQKKWQEKKQKLEEFCQEQSIILVAQPYIDKGVILKDS